MGEDQRFIIGRAFGILPTDRELRNLSPFQSLWLYTHIKKEQTEERRFLSEMVKLLCYMVNPAGAKRVFEGKSEGFETETVSVTEQEFINSLKLIDPNFNTAEYLKKMENK